MEIKKNHSGVTY